MELLNSIKKEQLQLVTSLESCDVIRKGDSNYKEALTTIISSYKEFAQNVSDSYQNEIQEIESKLSSA